MKIDGGCHCGKITYEAVIDPGRVTICHCTDCQQQTGSAFRVTTFVPDGDFRILQGSPSTYLKTTAESGGKSVHAFCGDCGSNLFVTPLRDGAAFHGIQVGTIRQRGQLRPSKQVWHRSVVNWLDLLPNLPEA